MLSADNSECSGARGNEPMQDIIILYLARS